jgi:hypothetical protein
MKLALLLLCATPALAQSTNLSIAACGKLEGKYKVKLDNSQHSINAPDPGKARVVFVHETQYQYPGYPVVRIALDGTPAGATHGNSYFSVSIEPGEHHLCTSLQSSFFSGLQLAHFTAEPGQTYYFRTRLLSDAKTYDLDLSPLDSDQGRHLVEASPLSIAALGK